MSNSSQTENKERCQKCGKARAQASASITQWLFRQDNCDCDILDYSNVDIAEEISQLCQTCGKPAAKGRSGSMTQWVFRAQSCNCENPVLNNLKVASNPTLALRATAALAAENNAFDTQSSIKEELSNPLDVDPGKFPSDRYVPLAIVGDGQHGIVYKAHDRLLKRIVAIKTVRTSKLTAEQLVQFQSEAKATSQLNHPNVVRLFDFGVTSDGVPFLVMEYFEGETLLSLIEANGPLPLTSGIFVLMQACAGLQHAHEKRILHRDLKSSNILIGTIEGRMFLKILDFGLSSLISRSPNDGTTTSLRGTPTYMSPEQVRELIVDERSDMYSLGCMAYEIFTGHVPFKEENALATMMKHVDGIPEALYVRNPNMEYNEDIEFIVAKTLEKNPNDRYSTINDLMHALQFVRFPEREALQSAKPTETISIPTSSTLVEVDSHSKAATRKSLLLVSISIISVAAVGVFLALTGIKPQAPDVPIYETSLERGHVFVDPGKQANMSNILSPPPLDGKQDEDSTNDQGIDHAPFLIVKRRGPGYYENPNATDKTLAILADPSKYPDMAFLSLRASGIDGTGLKHIANRPLLGLTLAQAPINGVALESISKMRRLKELNLNHVRIPINEYYKLHPPELERLEIDNTTIDDTTLDIITKKNAGLTYLSLRVNPLLTNKSFKYLKRLRNLKTLNISDTNLSGAGFKELTSLKNLVILWHSNGALVDSDIDALIEIPTLRSLILNLSHATDKALKKLEGLKTDVMVLENTKHLSVKAKAELARKAHGKVTYQDMLEND